MTSVLKWDAITVSFHFDESRCEYEGYDGTLGGEMKSNKPNQTHTSHSVLSSSRWNWGKLKEDEIVGKVFFYLLQYRDI